MKHDKPQSYKVTFEGFAPVTQVNGNPLIAGSPLKAHEMAVAEIRRVHDLSNSICLRGKVERVTVSTTVVHAAAVRQHFAKIAPITV